MSVAEPHAITPGSPVVVKVDMQIHRLRLLSKDSQSCSVDFTLWLEHQPAHAALLRFEDLEFLGSIQNPALRHRSVFPLDNGNVVSAYRVIGIVESHWLVQYFPFDTQAVQISFRHAKLDESRLLFRPVNQEPFTQADYGSPRPLITSKALGNNTIWKLGKTSLTGEEVKTLLPRTPGITIKPTVYSSISAAVTIRRDSFRYMIKTFFPVFILLFLIYLSLYIPDKLLGAKIGLGITAMLTAIIISGRIGGEIPLTGVLTVLEKVLIVFYCLIVLAMVAGILQYRFDGQNWMRRFKMITRIAYPCVILVMFVTVRFLYWQ